MDKFIKLLLETENTVILPGFGAIVVENENTGKLMFNEYLKFNDGKLDNAIVANSNMDVQEAQNYVAKYVREIQMQIDKGESYDIYQLGKFYKSEDGAIEFEGNKSGLTETIQEIAGPSPTSFPLEGDKVEEVVEVVESDFIEEEQQAEIEEESITPAVENTESAPADVAAGNQEIDSKSGAEEINETSPAKRKNVKQKSPKKRKGALFFVIILLLLLLIGGGVFVGLNYEEVRTYMGWNDIQKPEGNKVLEESVEQSEREVESEGEGGVESEDVEQSEREVESERGVESQSEEKVVAPKPVAVSQGQGGRFHIIVGSFGDANNANRFVADLNADGHNASVAGERNGLQLVSVASFNGRQEANNAKSNYQQINASAWVYEAK
ncbi:MAG: SPOR domain-containing protein [Crocinitomicaceae bacterium]|nr:SPOR domain-containing protein [Crocinitomicaceae bacterium]